MQNNLTPDELKFRWILNSWIDISIKICTPQIKMIVKVPFSQTEPATFTISTFRAFCWDSYFHYLIESVVKSKLPSTSPSTGSIQHFNMKIVKL
jgi:hypothetical protein